MNKEGTTEKEGKYKHKYSCIALSNTWLALSCLLACVVALWSTQTYCCYEYVLCCSVQGRLNAVLLCLRYVDTVVVGAWFVSSWRVQKKDTLKNKTKQKGKKLKEIKNSPVRARLIEDNNYFLICI